MEWVIFVFLAVLLWGRRGGCGRRAWRLEGRGARALEGAAEGWGEAEGRGTGGVGRRLAPAARPGGSRPPTRDARIREAMRRYVEGRISVEEYEAELDRAHGLR